MKSHLGRIRKRLRELQQWTVRAQLAEQHHLHPRVACEQQLKAVCHGIDIVGQGPDVHLHAGNSKRCHTLQSIGFVSQQVPCVRPTIDRPPASKLVGFCNIPAIVSDEIVISNKPL